MGKKGRSTKQRKQSAKHSLTESFSNFRVEEEFLAFTGRGNADKDVLVPNRPGYIFIRIPKKVVTGTLEEFSEAQAFSKSEHRHGVPVKVARSTDNPSRYEVVDIWPVGMGEAIYQTASSIVMPHARSHEMYASAGGYDPVMVDPMQMKNLQVRPTSPPSSRVTVGAGWYVWKDRAVHWFDGTTVELADHIPSGTFPFEQVGVASLWLDPDTQAVTANVQTTLNDYNFSMSDFIEWPSEDYIPLAAIRLKADDYEIGWSTGGIANFVDMRSMISLMPGDMLPAGHPLDPDGGYHTGTLPSEHVTDAGSFASGTLDGILDELWTNAYLRMQEVDGDPDVRPVREIQVSSGTLVDLGDGVVRLTTGGGGGGGSGSGTFHTLQEDDVDVLVSGTIINFEGDGAFIELDVIDEDPKGTISGSFNEEHLVRGFIPRPEFITASAGAANAEDPILLDPDGLLPESMINLVFEELDGSPSIANVKKVVIVSGTLTDLGDGVVQLETGSGGGGAVTVTKTTFEQRTRMYDETLTATGTFDIDLTAIDDYDTYDWLEFILFVVDSSGAMWLMYNGDATQANYYMGYGQHGTVVTDGDGALPNIGDADARGTAGVSSIQGRIYAYQDTSRYTSAVSFSMWHRDDDDSRPQAYAHQWLNTDAVTSIQLERSGGSNLPIGSRLILIGVKEVEVVTDVVDAGGVSGSGTLRELQEDDATVVGDPQTLNFEDDDAFITWAVIDEGSGKGTLSGTFNEAHLERGFVPRPDFLGASAGASDVGKAIKLDDEGLLPASMMPLTVEEQDGTPSVDNVTRIKVTDDTLTDEGGGTVSIDTGGGGGGGTGTFNRLQEDDVDVLVSGTILNFEDDDAYIVWDVIDEGDGKGTISGTFDESHLTRGFIPRDAFITTSAGAANAGDPILLDPNGLLPESMINLVFEESDGTPSVSNVKKVIVTTGTLTDLGGGEVQVDTSGNDGGGSTEYTQFVVKNTSGAAASTNDVGYINEDGEYKTTTTVGDNVSWCVVLTGGADNADIYVARRGRVTVAYTGAAPSSNDYLITSATAGYAQGQSYMSPEIFAVCVANGSGGTVEALLMTQRTMIPLPVDDNIYSVLNASDSDFVSTIATLPGGVTLTYGAVTSGAEDTIVPWYTANYGKLVLHNTTRSDYALVEDVDTGTNTITLTAAVPGTWQVGDTITARSQTNTDLITNSYFQDVELEDAANVPANVVLILGVFDSIRDTGGGAGLWAIIHPFEAGQTAKRRVVRPVVTNVAHGDFLTFAPLVNRRLQFSWHASGASTFRFILRAAAVIIAGP